MGARGSVVSETVLALSLSLPFDPTITLVIRTAVALPRFSASLQRGRERERVGCGHLPSVVGLAPSVVEHLGTRIRWAVVTWGGRCWGALLRVLLFGLMRVVFFEHRFLPRPLPSLVLIQQ